MTKLRIVTIAAAIALAACSAAAQQSGRAETVPAPSVQPLDGHASDAPYALSDAASCDVRFERTRHGVLIEARAFAERGIDGEYQLTISKYGGGNASDISQGGPLTLAAGESVTLGQNEISMERGARIRARLTLQDANGEICSHVFTL